MIFDPIGAAARRALARAWERVPAALRRPGQFLGRHYAGCGATIGLMPRCDLSCQGCYLGADADAMRPKPLEEIKAQVRVLRDWLGPGGNLQITDGEATLRPEVELVELLSYARAQGLVPMLMTHGETLRRRPGLLERLMERGGLSEISFHVDSTMRGRRGVYGDARREEELHGLREEFAEMIRGARRRTGRRLEAASTMTVHRGNLDEVPGVARWYLAHADAFKMASFLPVAKVGRTEEGLEGVGAEELWTRLAQGTGRAELLDGSGFLGHPACSRFVQGVVFDGLEKEPVFEPLYQVDRSEDAQALEGLLSRLGGASFRLDGRAAAARRALAMLVRHPAFLASSVLPHGWRLLGRASAGRPWRLLAGLLGGRVRARYFNFVSHHFMSREETASPLGQERLSLCAFKAPVDGRLTSMCEINASGLRQAYYEGRQSRELSSQS